MKRFKNILYVADPSGVALKAFQHAVGLAERNSAKLTVIQVMEPIPPYLNRMTSHLLLQARIKELETDLDALRGWAAGRVEIEAKIMEGSRFLEIIRDVLRSGRDLVIKPADGNLGAVDRLFGTADMHLLRKCPCPVWLVKSDEITSVRRVMACVDAIDLDSQGQDPAQPLNRLILEIGGSLCGLEPSEFHVVHAWEAIGETVLRRRGRTGGAMEGVESYVEEMRLKHRHWLDQLLSKAREWGGPEAQDAVKPVVHIPKGSADDVIPRLARELKIDVIVMGTVARTGIPGFFIGNTAESVLNQIRCSVLAVKPTEFVTPVTLGN